MLSCVEFQACFSVRTQALSFSKVLAAPVTRLSVFLFVSDQRLSDLVRPVRYERWWKKRAPREKSSFTAADEWRIVAWLPYAARHPEPANQILQWGPALCDAALQELPDIWEISESWWMQLCHDVSSSWMSSAKHFFILPAEQRMCTFRSLSSAHEFWFE